MNYPVKLTNGYYRVRKSWEDEDSQIGSYRLLASAKNKCDENPGTFVFDEEGNAFYPEVEIAEEVSAAEVEAVSETADIPAEEPVIGLPQTGYAKLKTLMNIRKEPSLEGELICVYKKGTIVKVLEVCENNWLKVDCPEAEDGTAYVSNEDGAYATVGSSLYTVKRKDNLWTIAKAQLGDGTRFTEIREVNQLLSNQVKIGMQLIIP